MRFKVSETVRFSPSVRLSFGVERLTVRFPIALIDASVPLV